MKDVVEVILYESIYWWAWSIAPTTTNESFSTRSVNSPATKPIDEADSGVLDEKT